MKFVTILKYLWALPNTLLGCLFVPFGKTKIVDGCIESHGRFISFLLDHAPLCKGAAALTLGHVILGQDQAALHFCRSHEHVHVRQYETFGPFFLPFYFLCSFHAWRQDKDPYYSNFLEEEAYNESP